MNYEPEQKVKKLNKELKTQLASLTQHQARLLVDEYYLLQKHRIATENQVRMLAEKDEAADIIMHFAGEYSVLENEMKNALHLYAKGDPVGQWALSITGIGPVLAAGLLAHIDMAKAKTAGNIWSYAGLTNEREWLGAEKSREIVNRLMDGGKSIDTGLLHKISAETGWPIKYLEENTTDAKTGKISKTALVKAISKRPWNASLKELCWKIGESFVKVSNNEKDVYGKIYQARKANEQRKNENGDYSSQAEEKLRKYRIGESTDAYKAYSAGMLPPAHIHSRAKRYAVKLFLAHWHHVAHWHKLGEAPPNPYPIAILGHADEIPVPNFTAPR